MVSHRICWAIVVVLCALSFVFADSVATLAALVIAIAVPLVSIAVARLHAQRIACTLTAPGSASVGVPATCTCSIEALPYVPLASANVKLVAKNAFAGTCEEVQTSLPLAVRSQTRSLTLTPSCCGVCSVAVEELNVSDMFGVARFKAACPEELRFTVACEEVPLQVSTAIDADQLYDSERYSMAQAGNDPSETYALREYQPGDPIKSIHWKLSQKTGELIVRELGQPIVDDVCLMFETGIVEPMKRPSPRRLNAMASAFLSVSRALVLAEIEHEICWQDIETGGLVSRKIALPTDLDAAADALMSCRVGRSQRTTPACYVAERGECSAAHIVTVSSYAQNDLDRMGAHGRLTAIVFARENSGVSPVRIISTSVSSYREDLAYLEV